MAKGIEMNGYLRGKRGGVVYSVLKGEQVSKAYNSQPANPKTDAQITQRVKLGAAVGFYKRNTQFFPFAFQKNAKESDYNAFVRENINVSPYISRQGVVGNQIIPAPYQMTRGNLPEFNTGVVALLSEESSVTFSVPVPTVGTAANRTVRQFREGIQAQIGDMITIYCVASTVDSPSTLVAEANVIRGYAKYTFKAEDEESPINDVNWDELFNSDMDIIPVSVNRLNVSFSFPDLAAEFEANRVCSGCAIVLSRKVSGSSLMVSSSKMNLSPLAAQVYARYRTDAMLQEAKNSYGVKQDAFLSPQKPNVPQP